MKILDWLFEDWRGGFISGWLSAIAGIAIGHWIFG